jgi:hypothetical protein
VGRRSRALLLLSALAFGCSPSPDVAQPLESGPPEDAGPFVPDFCKPSLDAGAGAALTIGEGQTLYRDIVDDASLLWEKGPQGGHHVWIALRQKNLRRIGTIITIDLHDVQDPASPKLINHSRLVFGFDRDEGGWCTLTGLRMQLDNAGIDLSALQNHRIEVKAKLDDPDGATASAVKHIIVSGLVD